MGAGAPAPAGLRYVGSWITQDLGRCYQVMECEFEVIPVVTSAEAQAAVAPRLGF